MRYYGEISFYYEGEQAIAIAAAAASELLGLCWLINYMRTEPLLLELLVPLFSKSSSAMLRSLAWLDEVFEQLLLRGLTETPRHLCY